MYFKRITKTKLRHIFEEGKKKCSSRFCTLADYHNNNSNNKLYDLLTTILNIMLSQKCNLHRILTVFISKKYI